METRKSVTGVRRVVRMTTDFVTAITNASSKGTLDAGLSPERFAREGKAVQD